MKISIEVRSSLCRHIYIYIYIREKKREQNECSRVKVTLNYAISLFFFFSAYSYNTEMLFCFSSIEKGNDFLFFFFVFFRLLYLIKSNPNSFYSDLFLFFFLSKISKSENLLDKERI